MEIEFGAEWCRLGVGQSIDGGGFDPCSIGWRGGIVMPGDPRRRFCPTVRLVFTSP